MAKVLGSKHGVLVRRGFVTLPLRKYRWILERLPGFLTYFMIVWKGGL